MVGIPDLDEEIAASAYRDHARDTTELATLRQEVERLRARNAELEQSIAAHHAVTPDNDTVQAVLAVDVAGTVLYADNEASTLLRAERSAMQPALDLVGLALRDVFTEQAPLLRVFGNALADGRCVALTEQLYGTLYEFRAVPVRLHDAGYVVLTVSGVTGHPGPCQDVLRAQRVLEERIASRNVALQVQVQERIRAEENLRREQGFFRLVLDTDPSHISVYDMQGRPLLVNRAFSTLFRFDETASLREMFQSDSPAWNLGGRYAEQVCGTGMPVRQECELEDEMGTFRWYDVIVTPLSLPTGERLALSIATDVTGRKVSQLALEQAHSEMEEHIKERTLALAELNGRLVREAMERLEAQRRTEESEARFKQLFFANQAVKLLVDMETRIVVEANEAAHAFYGYPREAMLGMRLDMFTSSPAETVNDRCLLLEKEGTARFEARHISRSGEEMDVEIFSCTLMDKGRPVIFSIVHDISERKRVERQVVEQRNHLTALMNAMDDSALLLDMQGRIITINTAASRAFGRDEQHMKGVCLCDVMNEKSWNFFQAIITKVRETGAPVREEFARQHAIWDVVFYPVKNMGRVVGTAVYGKDVTERKHADERLRWLSARVLSAQEEERKRIGRELHDSTAQTLSGIKYMVEADLAALERSNAEHDTRVMHKVVSLLQGAIIELRRIIMDLRPTVLDDLGLLAALRWLQGEFSSIHGHINVRLWLDMDESCLDEMQKSVLFRVAQEGMANVGRHSRADAASLSLAQEGTNCYLTITDNGVGFDGTRQDIAGIGLDSMRERLELVEGQLHIVTEKGMGTQILAVVPLRNIRFEPDSV